MGDQSTNWYLKLMDHVSSPLKKIMDFAGGAQKKITDLTGSTQKLTAAQNVQGRDFKNNLQQLNARLETLKDLQAKAFSIKHIENYNKAIAATQSEINKLNKVINPPAPPLSMWGQFKRDIGGIIDQVPGLSNVMSLLRNPIGMAATALLTLGTASTTMAYNFETGMAKINATAQLGSSQLAKLDDRLTQIGANSGGNFDRIPETYERILSVTGKVNQSLALTELAVKGAKAGFTDLDIVGNALARTMSTIQDSTVQAKDVLDLLMMAKNVGAGEFKDFAQYIPGLIASAQPAGYNHKDAISLFSTLSKSFDGTEASMYTQNLFTAFKKTDIIYGLEKAGIKVFENGFRRPIGDVLLDLAKLQKAMNPEQFTNFMDAIKLKDAQAATAIGAITGNTKNLEEVVNGLNRALGETDRQLAATANTARTWSDIGDEFKAMGKAIGDFLLPVVDVLVQGLASIGRGLSEIFSGKIFQRSSWRDDDAILKAARENNARDIALQRTREHYKLGSNENFNSREQFAFFNSIYKQNLARIEALSDKNKIVSDDKESKGTSKGKALFNVNKGINMANDAMNDNKKGTSSDSGSGSGNKGPNSITMNLYVTNHFSTTQDDDAKIKRKVTDWMVDAARDAAVTIGV